ncbi:MAG: energy-coupled thiamine transporter ThiT [Lachnospiraceae bacterium]|nr:energy-coupled thiamine transporter ThiT [Lachnospiraceae bacterium]
MSNFFAFPTVNSWDENVFQLTPAGIITVIVLIVALIALALIIQPKEVKSRKFSTKQLVFSAVAMALAIVTSMIKVFELPMGGSVTLFSMLFIVLIGYWYGPKAGLMTGFAYGLLQFVLDPVFYSVPQMIVDYPLAFGALGLSGFFSNKKYGLQIGYVVGIFGRFVFAFLSGLLFFAAYAEGSGMSAPIYSICYNGSYIATEGIITLVILCIPPVANGLRYIKKMTLEQ